MRTALLWQTSCLPLTQQCSMVSLRMSNKVLNSSASLLWRHDHRLNDTWISTKQTHIYVAAISGMYYICEHLQCTLHIELVFSANVSMQ